MVYDKDYYEYGPESGKSNYSRYRWIPELTIPMAMTIIDYLEIKSHHRVLDLGCAKGYLVKAFHWLRRPFTWGVDTSNYAIENCDPEVKGYCSCDLGYFDLFDFIIAKDVFEHILLGEIADILYRIKYKKIFAVIPLGENGKYRAPANDLDVTHVNCMDESEWTRFFEDHGSTVEKFKFKIDGIKDNYYKNWPMAHGFFILKKS